MFFISGPPPHPTMRNEKKLVLKRIETGTQGTRRDKFK